jgi:hypothetical protein
VQGWVLKILSADFENVLRFGETEKVRLFRPRPPGFDFLNEPRDMVAPDGKALV